MFILAEKKKKISQKTVLRRLEVIVAFNKWSSKRDIFTASTLDLQSYFDYLKEGSKYSHVLEAYTNISIFFRWCKTSKQILVDPLESIKITKKAKQITVCSPEQCIKLFSFIKGPQSDPEQAILLALILIWGLKGENLSFAQIELQSKQLKIILRRKKLTNKKHYYREQILDLPSSPTWFNKLQKRFLNNWNQRYIKLN